MHELRLIDQLRDWHGSWSRHLDNDRAKVTLSQGPA